MPERGLYLAGGKRILDLVVASTLLLLALPLMALIALAVKASLGSPVLFRQERPGRRGELFKLTKFRTMREPGPSDDGASTDEIRLSGFGRWMRSTSLDELPELMHVLSGRMSLVGPRPLLAHYLPLYSARQFRRHEVRPGITGLAQVSGRNTLGWEARLELDVQYVERLSFALDCGILARTIGQVLRREGISQPGRATVDEFKGPRAS